jgi:hypothetical protein
MSKLLFEIKGDPNRISLTTYSSATAKLVQLLRELDVAISRHGHGSLQWYISGLSKNGSLGIEIRSEVRKTKDEKRPLKDVSVQVTQSLVTGFENIEELGISPPFLSEFGLEKLNGMMSLLHKNGAKGFAATAVEQKRSVSVSDRAANTLRDLLPPKRDIEGSVEGRLETISVHGQKRFVLYHSLTGKAVSCKIESDSDLQKALQALGKKVWVAGTVSINVKSEPLSVKVREFRVLGSGRRLPTAAELTGSDPHFTGDMGTDEYIRSIRRG